IPVQARAQIGHLVDSICHAGLSKVRKQVVIVRNSQKAGVHGSTPAVCLEERGQRGSGRLIHRASRYENSTALMTSCTHAPSEKSPCDGESERISEAKFATRLL